MPRELRLPLFVGLVATVLLALLAGLGDWSAAAIYGGMAVIVVLVMSLLAWLDARGEHPHR